MENIIATREEVESFLSIQQTYSFSFDERSKDELDKMISLPKEKIKK